MKYAFCVESKRNAKVPFATVFVRNFEGGYVGEMLLNAKNTARKMGGKVRRSVMDHIVEAPAVYTKRAVAELFEVSVYDVHEEKTNGNDGDDKEGAEQAQRDHTFSAL